MPPQLVAVILIWAVIGTVSVAVIIGSFRQRTRIREK